MSIFLLKNISKTFESHNGDFYALKNVSLTLPSTGLVSIVGKSGSGKSTLLNILLGIEKPSSGSLLFCNRNISKMNDKAFSKYHLKDVSMVFQHYNLFSELTAKENIMLPLLIKGASKSKASKRAEELLDRFSISYLTNQKAKLMSGGEMQRVAIARALAISPKVILCDEPTGALDTENSEKIMQILKKLSSSVLILMVSHNLKLVEKYSSRIITLKDGEVVDDRQLSECFDRNVNDYKVKYSSKWTNLFTRINFKLNIKKNVFSIIACMFGFASIFLSFGFYNGSQISQDNALKNNLSVLHASASEKTFFDIENSPLSYEKSVKPSYLSLEKNLNEFDYLVYEPNLNYLFSPYPYGRYQDQVIENFQLIPLYDISLSTYGRDLLVSGSPPNDNLMNVIVNEEFVKLLGLTNEESIDDIFNISYSTSISLSTGDYENPFVKDDFSYEYDLVISAVVKEFSFLNTPKIYYSYPALKEELDSLYLENISEYFDRPITYLEYIEDASEDDPISSYSYEVFLTSINESTRFFNKIEELNKNESSFQIESTAYDIKQSYKTFIESFSTALFVFVIITFIGVNFILGMISLSTFIENKKNSAILTCLGARNNSIQSIYLSENYLVVIVSILISIPISILIQLLLNKIIYKNFALSNLIDIPFLRFMGVPLILPLAITLIAFIFSLIFTLTPMFVYRHISLSDELRDE